MSVILILITASFGLAIIFLIAFVWAIKTGQFEDDYTPSLRILNEENGRNTSKNDSEEISI